jgi:type IV pilus assembly protein PilC
LRFDSVRRAGDRFVLRLPILGAMFRSYYIANFTRTFSLLLKSEIGITQTLKIVGDTMGNAAYKQVFEKITAGVVRGGAVAEIMENDKLLFPPLVSQMVSVGEMTGNLGSSLMYLSEMYEDEMNTTAKNLTVSIEPILMIFMGVLVGFIAMSIITPIYGITQSLH